MEISISGKFINEKQNCYIFIQKFLFLLNIEYIKYEVKIIRVEAICAPIAMNIIEILLINFIEIVI